MTSGISEKYICPQGPVEMSLSFTGVIYEVTILTLKALSGALASVWTLLISPLVLPGNPPRVLSLGPLPSKSLSLIVVLLFL